MIAYYAHSHGSGHCNYAQLYAYAFLERLMVFSSADYSFSQETNIVRLPDEDCEPDKYETNVPDLTYLHYSPTDLAKIAKRNYIMLLNMIAESVRLCIVDVSVEVAMLCKVSSIPYVYIRMFGERNDTPHLNAYEGAIFLIAHYPETLENASVPQWVKDKTLYTGFFSRFSSATTRQLGSGEKIILYVKGFGGKPLEEKFIKQILQQFPSYTLQIAGQESMRFEHPRLKCLGVINNIEDHMRIADFIMGACGMNSVSEIASMNKKFIAVPEARPFDEQEYFAKALHSHNLARQYSPDLSEQDLKSFPFANWQNYVCPDAPTLLRDWLTMRRYNYALLRQDVATHHTLLNLSKTLLAYEKQN